MSTVLASRNNHQSSYMGEIPNYMNPNPNPNRNPKPKSKKIKHFSNNHQVKKDSAGDAYSFNQRPVENNNGFDCGGYVSYKVGSCSRSEINELRRKLVSDLERIRKLNDRIQSGEFSNPPNNSRSVNGKIKKVGTGNKRPLSSFREMGNGDGGVGVMDEEMLKKCKQVLTKLMKHKMSWVFKAPVDVVGLGLHDYHQIIKRPMDLGTVKSNLSKGFYSNVADFAADVRLVFENAMLYNPRTDDVHGMADQMLRIFEDLFRPIQAKLAKNNERGNGNERVGNVHGMANKARVFDVANERVVNVNDMVNDVVNEVNRVNEFSAVDELDGSSWDDIQTPERPKKAKSEAKSSGFPVASKQIHSTASNAVNAVIPPVVHSPVRMPSRTPSPMQVTEPVKPSNTSTMTRTVLPKLPKPRAKDPNKREMNMEEKQKLGLGLQSMPPEKMPQLLQIIRKRNDQLAQEGDEIELDIEALDTETLWELDRFVTNWKKFVSKTKRQALMVNSASAVAAPSGSADIDDVPMSEKIDGVKKNKKEAGEEDVDIGGGGQGQAATGGGQGNNDNNASRSSSGSSSSSAWQDQEHVPNAVGWELHKGKRVPRRINLSTTMDPIRMAISAADLNLKLMRWRALPSLDLSMLSSTKCLLLGAGTLGCQVARMLMAWGVRKITLVDSGKVAMSNPLRQSLYTLEDCLDGGDLKALAAVKSLKRIFPAVEAEGVVMAIPMPGHPVPSQEEQNVLDDCRRLHDLVDSHDAVFLLTDTRESRWLPTLLCANANKLTVTAALGFDSFLVMRHGAGPLTATDESKTESVSSLSASVEEMSLTQSDSKLRLGCYFCNDVVAPIDSTANRTLDQQCTVTRPGLAPIASALAVELLVGILHHPLGISAKAEFGNSLDSGSDEQPLGILPHQIRGALSQFSQMILVGHSSNSCTACCPTVVSEYRKRGLDFVLQAINHPTYLEDLTGLTELMKSANSFELDWDNETDNDDEDCVEI